MDVSEQALPPPLSAVSQDLVPGVPRPVFALLSLSAFSALGSLCLLHTFSPGAHQTPTEVTIYRASLPELSLAHALLPSLRLYMKTSDPLG